MIEKNGKKLIPIKSYKIIDWDNFLISNFNLNGKPFWLKTDNNKILICCHYSLYSEFDYPEEIKDLINKFINEKYIEIELICCYPNSAKNTVFQKYIEIDSNFPIYHDITGNDKYGNFIFLYESI